MPERGHVHCTVPACKPAKRPFFSLLYQKF